MSLVLRWSTGPELFRLISMAAASCGWNARVSWLGSQSSFKCGRSPASLLANCTSSKGWLATVWAKLSLRARGTWSAKLSSC